MKHVMNSNQNTKKKKIMMWMKPSNHITMREKTGHADGRGVATQHDGLVGELQTHD
jgi:hypothetical protein